MTKNPTLHPASAAFLASIGGSVLETQLCIYDTNVHSLVHLVIANITSNDLRKIEWRPEGANLVIYSDYKSNRTRLQLRYFTNIEFQFI